MLLQIVDSLGQPARVHFHVAIHEEHVFAGGMNKARMPPGGGIQLAFHQVTLGPQITGNLYGVIGGLAVHIDDSGPGMAQTRHLLTGPLAG
jgi:hypothetical protein